MDAVVYRKRTVASALMMLFALGLGSSGYLLTGINQHGAPPQDWPIALGAWFGLGALAWGVTRWRLPYADPLLLPTTFLLHGLGLSMIYRLDQADRLKSASLQFMWLAISLVGYLAVVFLLRDHRRLQRFTYLWFALGGLLLVAPLLPGIGFENHGARIWIKAGPLSFQPAEIAKVILSIAFAAYLVEKKEVLALAGRRFLGIDLPRPRDLGPIAAVWLFCLGILVFQKDLGTTLLFFSLFVVMLYIATERPSWAILGVLLIGVLAFGGYYAFDHVQRRFDAWLNPFSDYDKNLQIISAQFGFASGGQFGTGWGLGRPYLTSLAKNDMIAAALGEELGLWGLCALVVCFAIIATRLLRAALGASEPFGKLLAAGLGFVFALQVFIIVGGVTRLLPLTGLTTPFVSQGGSSLVANFVMLGLMMTITHQVRRPQVAAPEGEYAVLASDQTQAIPVMATGPTPGVEPRPDPQAVPARTPNPDAEATQVVVRDEGGERA